MQFEANLGIIDLEQFKMIQTKHICITGLGGLGGYVAHALVRFGFKHLMLIDHDVFELSNLNRQMFSTHQTLHKSKVSIIKQNVLQINPQVEIKTHQKRIEEIPDDDLSEIDLMVDAVDNISTKIYLEALASKIKKPLCHGAIGGWYGQFGIFTPNTGILKSLYNTLEKGLEGSLKSPTFAPAIVGNLMALEIIKYFAFDNATVNQLIHIDLEKYAFDIIYTKGGECNGES